MPIELAELFALPTQIPLPEPWPRGHTLELRLSRQLTWLVGPNGTGKSRFLRALRDATPGGVRMRLLGTDRLSNIRVAEGLENWGNPFANGLVKSQTTQLLHSNRVSGHLTGVSVLLQQRADLRIRIQATLGQLLGRFISLDVVDGYLKPTMKSAQGASYDLFSNEAHGVLELITLLANLYDDEVDVLLIDEPELNLHPQYQAFLLSEIRRARNKRVVVATHSPFFLDVRTVADLENVVVFHPDFRAPSSYRGSDQVSGEVQTLLPRMTEQHRSFFFASRPVFVEGYHDATVIGIVVAVKREVGFSPASADAAYLNSCVPSQVPFKTPRAPCLGTSVPTLTVTGAQEHEPWSVSPRADLLLEPDHHST